MKKILVTGGAGFIGSNLCERLIKNGHKVISLDNYFVGLKENHIEGVDYREGNTKDIEKHVPEKVDLVYHLGEYARVEKSLEDEPSLIWESNIAGTFAVLEYCRKNKIKIVYAGSSTKFGDGGLARDATPYAWTKSANTELVKNYGNWYGLDYSTTYFYNVYGPHERGDAYGTVVARFCERFLKGEPLRINSPGTQIRNFTYISDIIDGLILVGEMGEREEYGLGNEKAYSIIELAQMFPSAKIEMMPETRGNRQTAWLDTSKSQALGWRAKVDLPEGLQKTIEYFRTVVTK